MRKLLLLLLSLTFLACQEDTTTPSNLTHYLPQDAAVIIRMPNPDLFFSHLNNNSLLETNRTHPLPVNLRKQLSFLEYFDHQQPAFLSFSAAEDDRIAFTYLQHGLPQLDLDSVQNRAVETFTSTYGEIKKYTLEGQVSFTSQRDSVLLVSNSRTLLENLLQQEKNARLPGDKDFRKVLKAASEDRPVILLNHQQLQGLTEVLLPGWEHRALVNFSNWTSLDIELSPGAIELHGISSATDSLPKTLQLFRGVAPSTNELPRVAPRQFGSLTSFSFENFELLRQNLSQRKDSLPQNEETQLLTNASEAGILQLEEGKVFGVRALNIEIPTSAFYPQREVAEEYNGIPIYHYTGSGFDFLAPIATPGKLDYFLFLDNFVLFAEDMYPLQEVITAFRNENTLANSPAYTSNFQSLSTEASLLLVSDNSRLRKRLGEWTASEYKETTQKLDFEAFPITAVQFIAQEGFAHVHAVLQQAENGQAQQEVQQTAGILLDAPMAAAPVFFRNHRSNGLDVAVQDIRNTLYLISPEGKIYWKKKLQEPILGSIQQVDLYRNGRYQLAFATEHSVQVIDRDGNRVKPFPLEFRDEITQPLALFDYDNNRKYRFLVVQGSQVYMYNSEAEGVNGFRFRKAGEEILLPPKHIRLGRKDYILVQEVGGKLHILSRTGNSRVEVKESLAPSGNQWYEHENSFVSSNEEGQLLRIDQQGRVHQEDLELAENHKLTSTAKTLVTLSDNQLRIREKTISLDFGLYTEPRIFYINNKIYVAVTDTQAHRVYLFDSQAELIPGFPVYGNSLPDLGNADGDASLELTVMGDEDRVLVYSLLP